MVNRIARLKKDNPDLTERSDVQQVAEDIDTYASLAALASSEGGIVLLNALNRDITATVNSLAVGYKTLPEIELRALCAQLDTRLQFARTLNRAQQNLDLMEETLKVLTT